MNNYLIWYTINGEMDSSLKSKRSSAIHNYIFQNGIKLKSKSNAFIYKSEETANKIVDDIREIAKNQILLFVTEISTNYQGWLKESQWDFLNKE